MKIRRLTIIQKLGVIVTGAGLLAPFFATGAVAEQQDVSAFARGANSWAQNCARCHNMRDAKEFRDDQWKVIVTHMRVRAGLSGQEARDILQFLQANN